MFRLPLLRSLAIAAVLALSGTAAAESTAPAALSPQLPELGVMGTIPLYWGEASELEEVLRGQAEAHWARAQLEEEYRLVPVAALTHDNLGSLDFLLLAQPRALAPAENVALDEWVRGGGRLLLFADPLLTGESRFGIGDRRRPQDVILLSPILRRWGLELQFSEDQPAGNVVREIAGRVVPVNLPGRFSVGSGAPVCKLEASGLLADCKIGKGRVAVLADAALLDFHDPAPEAAGALAMLVRRAFRMAGENTGTPDGTPSAVDAYAESAERPNGEAGLSEEAIPPATSRRNPP